MEQNYYRIALYNFYINESKIRNKVPPVTVVGASNYPVQKIRGAEEKRIVNKDLFAESEKLLDKTVKTILQKLINENQIKNLKRIDTQIAFESNLKIGDKVEGRLVHNYTVISFPAIIIQISSSSIRVKTILDNMPYNGEKQGRVFSLPIGINKRKSKNIGVFPIKSIDKYTPEIFK